MSVDTSVSSSSSQVLVLSVRNVKMSLWISVLLCQSEINYVYLISTFTDSHQEVIRFNITMNEVA